MGRDKGDEATVFSVISAVRVTEHRKGLSGEVAESPSLEILKAQLESSWAACCS